MKDFLSQAAKLLKEQKQYRRRVAVFLCLAVIVGYGTVMALKLYGQAMNHKMEVLDCGYQAHEHTDECYELDEEGNRISEEPICGYADYVIHVHNDSCYDKDGELVCPLEEHELHEHTEECYVTETVLICGETAEGDEAGQGADGAEAGAVGESPAPAGSSEAVGNAADGTEGTGSAAEAGNAESTDGAADSAAGTEGAAEPQQDEIICGNEAHKHDESCYENVLNCGYAEEHVHTADCISHELICEIPEHTHGEACYDADGNLVCGMEEHTHEIGCFDEEGNTLCNTENHIHDESCLNAEGKIVCGPEGHEHIIGCYRNYYSCDKKAHVHSESCYTQNTICGMEEHEHGDECYALAATAVPEENGTDTADSSAAPEATAVPEATAAPESGETAGHVHTDACYQEVKTLVCEEQDELHIHDNSCYAEDCFDEEGNLIEGSRPSCGLLQLEEHTHTEDCIKTVELTPEEVEALNQGAKLHIHAEECYDEEGNLICGHDATHAHMPECYDDAGKLICGYGTESHVHEDKCYDDEGNLICGYETAKHPHTAECYDAEGNLQCGYETDTHVHDENCYDEDGNVICGYEAAAHVHQKECYDAEGNLQCGYETAKHEHEDSCYDEAGNLICGYNEDGLAAEALYCDESIHTHDESCYDENGNLICGKADFVIHTHTNECYNVDGLLICPLPEIEAHTHSDECYRKGPASGEAVSSGDAEDIEEGGPFCGKEEIKLHTHTDNCYDENGVLVCGQLEILEHMHSEACQVSNKPITRTFEGGSFIVTATYKPDAGIPEEAELIVEQITEESDEEHYSKRQTEYQEALGDDKATINILMKVGFYVDGVEIEPETPVFLTVQLLDENGMKEGSPVTVVHFTQEGAEVLDGSNLESGSTSFEMGSFSEIAIGSGTGEKVYISTDFAYQDEAFNIIFHIEGNAVPVKGEAALPESVKEIVSKEVQPVTVDGAVTEEENGEEGVLAEEEGSPDNQDNQAEEASIDKLQFQVKVEDKDSEEYATYEAFTESRDNGNDQLKLQVMTYSLSYGDIPLDTSECKITAEITPTVDLMQMVESELNQETANEVPEGEEEREVILSALQKTPETDNVEVADTQTVTSNASSIAEGSNTIIVDINGNSFAIDLSGTPNPHFSVQYYAWLDRANLMRTRPADDNETYKLWGSDKAVLKYLELIDTSKEANGGSVKHPTNGGGTPNTAYLELENKATGGKVKTEDKLTKIYSDRTDFEYYKQPTIEYLNAAIVNKHYELKEIWVLRNNRESSSTNRADWQIYTYSKDLHLTNREGDNLAAEGASSGYVYIQDGTIIRLVYDTTIEDDSFDAAFYDYDISDTKTTDGYINVAKGGINSTLPNGLNTGAYAFGNQNCGTAYGYGVKWNGNKLNAGNNKGNGGTNTFGGCTFGLVQGVIDSSEAGDDGKKGKTVEFTNGVVGPEIFGTTDLTGKFQYPGTLTFNRSGDTYTLNAAQGQGIYATDLSSFRHPKNGSTTYKHIWTNGTNASGVTAGFWPVDQIQNHDIHFGATTKYVWGIQEKMNGFDANGNITASSKKELPPCDDGKEHNSFFGMTYAVNFELVKDYEGPLEYYFFGDDDMWVFLDDTQLICDIGGVHSAVGEYVNLWDYLEVNKSDEPEQHTLRFFYTERGASGSTCWMQFTLPSVSSITPETTQKDYGKLRIDKEVVLEDNSGVQTPHETGDEFVFAIRLTDENGNKVQDDYAYTKYYADGKEKESALVLRDGSAFTLKNGEYIIINHLRAGTKYIITEQDKVLDGEIKDGKLKDSEYDYSTDVSIRDILPGEKEEDKVWNEEKGTKDATGQIPAGGESQIKFTNKVPAFKLPETGGSGTILYTMAGGMIVLFGAGFLYKKKFRERRG